MSGVSFFKNCSNYVSPAIVVAIHHAIEDNKGYAYKIYKTRASDALSEAEEHAIKHYKPGSNVNNYVVSTIKNILNKKDKAGTSTEDEVLLYHIDSQQSMHQSPTESLVAVSSVDDCVADFIPYIVKDYRFFSSLDPKDSIHKVGFYSRILNQHEPEVVLEALQVIQKEYIPSILSFHGSVSGLKPLAVIRNWNSLENLRDFNMSFLGSKDNFLFVQGTPSKSAFKVDFEPLFNTFSSYFFGGSSYYWGFSDGFLVESEFRDLLSRIVVKLLCAFNNVKFIGVSGSEVFFSGSIKDTSAFPYLTFSEMQCLEV